MNMTVILMNNACEALKAQLDNWYEEEMTND